MRAIFLLTLSLILGRCAPPSSQPNGGFQPSAPDYSQFADKHLPGSTQTASHSIVTSSAPEKHVDRINFKGDFDPRTIELNCKSGLTCPAAVGVLVFALPKTQTLEICTATLIERDKIATAEHCDFMKDASAGYFITRKDITGGARIRKVANVAYDQFTPNEDPKKASGYPDIAVMTLAEGLDDIAVLPIARGEPKAYGKLQAWVVQKGVEDFRKMTLDQLNCVVHEDAVLFPYSIKENPTMIRAFDCEAQGGNSGSPMVSDGVIEAILDARSLTSKGERPFVLATNFRCTDYPSQTKLKCVEPTPADMTARSDRANREFSAKFFNQTTLSVKAGAALGFKRQLSTLKSVGELRYEVFLLPSCRTAKWDEKSIQIKSKVQYSYRDDWGNLRVATEGETQTTTGKVLYKNGDDYMIDFQWSPAPGTSVDPKTDPRQTWGKQKGLPLPLCPSPAS